MRRIRFSRRLLIIPPIALGVVIAAVLVRSREGPEQREVPERRTAVRVLQVQRTSVVPRAIGYGVVAPGRVWHVVAQVAGRVVEKNPQLEAGALMGKGTVLLRIDPRRYELAVRETEAQIAKIEAELAELAMRAANTESTLEIERRSLLASERELARKRQLVRDNIVAQSDVDQEESRYLQQLVRVGDTENSLRLIPSAQQALEANKLANEAKLQIARLDLEHATIEAPYHCRIVTVDFEQAQYVGVGQQLAEAHGVAVAEITAHVPVATMRHLVPAIPSGPDLLPQLLTGEILDRLQLEAAVRLRTGGYTAEWEARFARIAGVLDPKTRTLGIVVAVDDPYELIEVGSRPPLVRDMYCEVELRGPPKPDRILIPRAAIHEGEVYIVEDGRLRRRAVEVEFTLGDFAVLTAGLEQGEVLVVSDPIPAIGGMLLDATVDAELGERIASVARGEAEIR